MSVPSGRDCQVEASLDLLKRAVTNYLYLGGERSFADFRAVHHYDLDQGAWRIERQSLPMTLLTGRQLDLIRVALTHVRDQGIDGDVLEAGVWRGGAAIFMRGLLDLLGLEERTVVAADSFAGIPLNTRATNDPVDRWPDRWVASLDEVKANVARFGMLDARVEFCVGFFEQSLPTLAGRRFAMIRLDSDSYDSVETSLRLLYPRVSQGGVVIIDDWHLPGCRMAVEAYRGEHRIADEIQVDDGSAFWTKSQPFGRP